TAVVEEDADREQRRTGDAGHPLAEPAVRLEVAAQRLELGAQLTERLGILRSKRLELLLELPFQALHDRRDLGRHGRLARIAASAAQYLGVGGVSRGRPFEGQRRAMVGRR